MRKGLNPDLKLVSLGKSKDGADVFATNFWELMAKLTPPGMVTGTNDGKDGDLRDVA